ncbi:MAG TPA: hypothetical protein VMA34_07905 [Terracidiphilus sp.]|nr:hypothetical protein [Terracidiphilus sp.]
MIRNITFATTPLVAHGHGPHNFKPFWGPVCERFFSSPQRRIGAVPGLTIMTWNNGAAGMGLLERSLDHLGVPCRVTGAGIENWVNSRHKPQLTAEAVASIETEYVMGIDSRDAILLGDPAAIVREFESRFDADLVFSADLLNWPNLKRFRAFENGLAGAQESDFRFLNSGVWIGRTEFCRRFFADAAATPPAEEAPAVDQGIFKTVFQSYYPRVQLDYRCTMFQNLGFVVKPIIEIC